MAGHRRKLVFRMGRRRGWITVGAILAVYVALVWLHSPAERFGRYHDDTLYASAALAIAEGDGLIQPNLPGRPPASKYPPAYPYALALMLRSFPGAFADPAALGALSAAAGVWALGISFAYLKRWEGVSWGLAAATVALCVSQQTFLLASGAVLSDVPFMALALTAFFLADRERPRSGVLIAAAAMAGLAMLTRTVGVAVAGGIVAAFLLRRDLRSALGFGLALLPFALLGLAAKPAPAALAAGASAGFRQTWLYYTDYVLFWRASVPDAETLLGMLYTNLGTALWAPAELCVGVAPSGQIGKIVWAVVTAAIVSGIVRQARADRWRSIHFGCLFTLPAVLLWNYEIGERLLLAFAPLFALGFWVEARHVVSNFGRTLRAGNPAGERVIAAGSLTLLAAFGVFVAQRTARVHIGAVPGAPLSYDEEYRELYAWMRENTRPDERFLAIDDGLFYLRTGRQGMWPLALTTEPRFRPDQARLEAQMERLPDVAQEIGARYIIHTDHDYAYAPMMQERWRQWTADLPVLIENPAGTARLLDLGCRPDCSGSLTSNRLR